ncbi:hypothetical protein PF003_g15514 [Phytophthora fragariae]|nr:hypothetical protein PF003_g15514 [Phytophthora fragariae]
MAASKHRGTRLYVAVACARQPHKKVLLDVLRARTE